MKQYIVIDDYSDYTKKLDYRGLKELLVEQLITDTTENHEDFDVVKVNLEVMEKLALEDYSEIKYLKEQLKSYGWTVLDLHDLQKDLVAFQAYKYGIGSPAITHDCIDKTLDMIDEEMK